MNEMIKNNIKDLYELNLGIAGLMFIVGFVMSMCLERTYSMIIFGEKIILRRDLSELIDVAFTHASICAAIIYMSIGIIIYIVSLVCNTMVDVEENK